MRNVPRAHPAFHSHRRNVAKVAGVWSLQTLSPRRKCCTRGCPSRPYKRSRTCVQRGVRIKQQREAGAELPRQAPLTAWHLPISWNITAPLDPNSTSLHSPAPVCLSPSSEVHLKSLARGEDHWPRRRNLHPLGRARPTSWRPEVRLFVTQHRR